MKNINVYKILKRLIRLSASNYGIIECDDSFYDSFSDIPREVFFNICRHLSDRLYIDYDYCDEECYSFDRLYILPAGYNSLETRKTNRINTILSVVAIIIALITLLISALPVLIETSTQLPVL